MQGYLCGDLARALFFSHSGHFRRRNLVDFINFRTSSSTQAQSCLNISPQQISGCHCLHFLRLLGCHVGGQRVVLCQKSSPPGASCLHTLPTCLPTFSTSLRTFCLKLRAHAVFRWFSFSPASPPWPVPIPGRPLWLCCWSTAKRTASWLPGHLPVPAPAARSRPRGGG